MLVDQGIELLTEEQCRDLIAHENVGRIGISVGALPAIFPVNYQMVGDDIFFRAGDGPDQRTALEGNVVGFEIDKFNPATSTGWSVLIVGIASEVADGDIDHIEDLQMSPWARGERTHLVRIHPEMISGRRILTEQQNSNASAIQEDP